MILVVQNEAEFLFYDSRSDFVASHFKSGMNVPWKFMDSPRGLHVQFVFREDKRQESGFAGVISYPLWYSQATLCMHQSVFLFLREPIISLLFRDCC